jgi:hypothetical protein
MNVVVVFGPVVSNEYGQLASLLDVGDTCSSRRTPGGNLMDQCSKHDTPSALQMTSPTNRGTI